MERQERGSLAEGVMRDVPAVWKLGDVILGQYQVKGILGEGGMGTVYLIHHLGWNLELAVKSPRPAIIARGGGKENFISEAETWMNLGLHPHIVSCYYVRTLGDIPRIFAEYVSGGSLADWIRTRKLYIGGFEQALRRMLDIAIQFAWGLHAAHEQGLVHQDVKPLNVMMSVDGIVKVTDFGLAKARAMAGEAGTMGTQQSILVSSRGKTPAYCSPEQDSGRSLSRKTDIWSWGIAVLEMFVGGVSWVMGTVALEALESYSVLDPLIPQMPPELLALLSRCFQSRPEDRPATMLDISSELQTLYARLVRQPYPRPVPAAAGMGADSLNNRALSLFDLGKSIEAMQTWDRALHIDRQHLETIYNRGIVLWRQGELTDESLVQQLAGTCVTLEERWDARYLLALVHLERGDRGTAWTLLEEAAHLAPEAKEVRGLLEAMRPEKPGAAGSGSSFVVDSGKSVLSLLADGRRAFLRGRDHSIQLWGVETGRCIQTFEGHVGHVDAVDLSADGRWAISCSSQYSFPSSKPLSFRGQKIDRTVWLWETKTGQKVRVFEGHSGLVYVVKISLDGYRAISGSNDHTIRLWEVETGRCLRIFEGPDVVRELGMSADGCWIVSSGEDKTVRLWEVETGQCVRTFEGHTGWVKAVDVSADGRWILSGSDDRTMRLWDASTGQCSRTFVAHTGAVNAVCPGRDGARVVSGGEDQTVRVWEIATGRCMRTFEGHSGGVVAVRMSPDGRKIFSGSHDRTIRRWEMPYERFTGSIRLSQVRAHSEVLSVELQAETWLQQAAEALKHACFTEALALATQVRALPGWERSPAALETWVTLLHHCQKVSLRTVWPLYIFKEQANKIRAVKISADGNWALLMATYKIQIWEVATGRVVRTFMAQPDLVDRLDMSADECLAVSGGSQKSLQLWEMKTGQCLRTFKGHTKRVNLVSLSDDGRWILSMSEDHSLKLWEAATGRCVRTIQFGEDRLYAACLNKDGRRIFSGGTGNTVQAWDVATGTCIRTFKGHTGGVFALSVSVDGRWIFSGGSDQTMRQWDVRTGQCLRIFEGHTAAVRVISVSANGRLVLTGSHDKTVRIWEVTTGHCIRVLEGHAHGIKSLSMSADGRRVFSTDLDEVVRLWECDWELTACEPADWDDGASPLLKNFLSVHMPYAGALPADRTPSEEEIRQALTRTGRPCWDEHDFQDLLLQLQYAGYGWLRQEGVRHQLEKLAASWRGLDPLVVYLE